MYICKFRLFKVTLNELQTIVANLHLSKGLTKALTTTQFTNVVYGPLFDPFEQEDAHETFIKLMDLLELELPQSKKQIFNNVIRIKGLYQIECTKCHEKREYVIPIRNTDRNSVYKDNVFI